MAQIEQERISALDSLVTQSADGVNELIESTAEAAKWAMAVDYVVPDDTTVDPAELVDRGTKRIPVNRIGLLTESRTVPQSMLPHQMDTIFDGTMVCTDAGTANEKWTFTVATPVEHAGETYVCPTQGGSGELKPDLGTIYRDRRDPDGDGNYIYTQYRYVPVDSSSGRFVPIPSDLVMVNGRGTVVTDNTTDYTRQVDVVLGLPAGETAPSGQEKSLLFSNGKLVHAQTLNTTGKFPTGNPASGALNFGDPFYIPRMTVNHTGHITAIATQTMYMPNTAATTGVAGLVKIGTNVQPIGSDISAGTVTPTAQNPYIEVAAANHVHNASKLTLMNVNDTEHYPTGSLEYNGAFSSPGGQAYDMRNILKANLPASQPSAAYQLLTCTGSGNNWQAAWANPADIITPEYVMCNMVSKSYGSASALPVELDTSGASYVHGGEMEYSSSYKAINGVKHTKAYALCFYFEFYHAQASATLEPVVVKAETGDGMTWTTVSTMSYVLDGSITSSTSNGVKNYVNGSTVFVVGNQGHQYARITIQTGNSSWTVDGNIQMAEVK